MGQSLSSPAINKSNDFLQDETYLAAISSMQGWRLHMEDSHTCFLQLPDDSNAAYFAVFDGHGGTRVAKYAAQHLHERIVVQTEYSNNDIPRAIRQAFLQLDAEMQAEMTSYHPSVDLEQLPDRQPDRSQQRCTKSKSSNSNDELAGSTGIVILIRSGQVYCGNAGDSRAVCSRLGVAEPLSKDHKPTMSGEKERIVAAGGWVDANRVNGNLALSRAFGDFVFKRNPKHSAENQIVSASPDVFSRPLVPEEDEFIVIGCDGIWDVMTNQEVISFVRGRLRFGMHPVKVCEQLMMRCLAPDCQANGLGCDNMTVVLVCFLFGRSINEFQQRCSRPCPAGPAADILTD